jgi:hypothetical protein
MQYRSHSPPEATASRKAVSDWSVWRQWIMANAIGELIGLGCAAALGAAVISNVSDTESTVGVVVVAVVMITGGVFEGIVVGSAQWRVLRHHLPRVAGRLWVVSTAAGACIAWMIGMIPSTLMSIQSNAASSSPPPEISDALIYLLAAAMGLVLGPILAFMQWLVLRRHVGRAGLWIVANAVAWALAMPVMFIGIGAIGDHGVSPSTIVFALGAITLAGAIVGAVHGLALLQLLNRTIETSVQNSNRYIQLP